MRRHMPYVITVIPSMSPAWVNALCHNHSQASQFSSLKLLRPKKMKNRVDLGG